MLRRPTQKTEEEIKYEFYEQLEEEIRTKPRHDVLMVVEDLNSTIGEEKTERERAMGTQGIGRRNNNGERLSDLCTENNLVIDGTMCSSIETFTKPHRGSQITTQQQRRETTAIWQRKAKEP